MNRAGAGPQTVPYNGLTSDKLANNIKRALGSDMRATAQELSGKMAREDGPSEAVKQFHNLQSVQKLSCSLCPNRTAMWQIRRTNV